MPSDKVLITIRLLQATAHTFNYWNLSYSEEKVFYTAAAYSPSQVDGHTFSRLVDQWHQERSPVTSHLDEIIACPSYLRIIALGRHTLPLIVEQLKREGDDPDHWCAALEAITGENPVPEESYGDTVGIAKAWISWYDRSAKFSPISTAKTFELPVPQLEDTTV